MQIKPAATALLMLVASVNLPAKEIKSDAQVLSYSFGVKTGQSYLQEDIKIESDAFVQGFKDGLNKNKLQVSEEQIEKTIMAYREEKFKEMQAERDKELTENLAASNAFLEANKQKEGIKETDSGLQYQVLREGKGTIPKINDTVVVNYIGTLIDGTEFDNSYKRKESVKFPVSNLIQGWQEALLLMPAGSKWKIYLPPKLAYGENGAGHHIKPNSTLIFELELVEIAKA